MVRRLNTISTILQDDWIYEERTHGSRHMWGFINLKKTLHMHVSCLCIWAQDKLKFTHTPIAMLSGTIWGSVSQGHFDMPTAWRSGLNHLPVSGWSQYLLCNSHIKWWNYQWNPKLCSLFMLMSCLFLRFRLPACSINVSSRHQPQQLHCFFNLQSCLHSSEPVL